MAEKKNYQTELDKIISLLDGTRPRVLLHSCCGPCSSYVIEYLSEYFELTVLFYNPNIHPANEYMRRLETQRELIAKLGGAVLCEGEYEPQRYFDAVKGLENEPEGGARCEKCIYERMAVTAAQAAKGGYDYFATTLTVSPHKNAQLINSLGFELEKECGVKWLPSDFKKRGGYQRSTELSRQLGLYRQNYCGCIFSNNNSKDGDSD